MIKRVALKDVLRQYRITHWVEDNEIYRQVTISQTGEVSFRGEKKGKDIGRKRQFIVDLDKHPNTLIFIRQGVFKGGIGLAPPEVNKCVVTENMPMFDVVGIKPGYLSHYLKSPYFKNDVNRLVPLGTAQKAIHEKQLLELEIPLPIEEVQDEVILKINSITEKKEKLSSLTDRNIELLSNLRHAILREAVSGKLVPQDPKDEPASELLKKINAEKEKLIREKRIKRGKELPISKEETPYELPEGWVWERLGQITNYGYSDKTESKNLPNNTWVLDLEDIEKETSKLLVKMRFEDRKSKSTKNIFQTGDVLYSKLRPYLDKVLVADENGVCTTEILPIRAYFGVYPHYLRVVLKSPMFIKYVNSVTYGMKMPRLGTADGQKALFPLPPFNEQVRIVSKVDLLTKLCSELSEEIEENQENSGFLMEAVLKEAFAS